MSQSSPFPKKSLFLAPMEGITDEVYRQTIEECFGGFDYMACDFLRIPASGYYKDNFIINHFGRKTYLTPALKNKTIYQVLASERSFTAQTITTMKQLGFKWIDLNLGCPSKKVNGHKGGAYLLDDPVAMEKVVRKIRENFPYTFTAKIRAGYENANSLEEIVMLLNDLGVDAITVHARTRRDQYKYPAQWNYIKRAVKVSGVPIVGNGDLWSVSDVKKMYHETDCHSVMIARGALKNSLVRRVFKKHR